MAETIDQLIVDSEIVHRIYVSRDYVYVQLHHQENYLYQVFSRHDGINVIREIWLRGIWMKDVAKRNIYRTSLSSTSLFNFTGI